MDISGSCLIPAPRDAVWAALGDPDVLKRIVPGCERIEKTGDDGFEGVCAAKVGPIRATFAGTAVATASEHGERVAFRIEAEDASAGAGQGTGEIMLSDAEGGTLVSYSGAFDVTGKVGQLGPRLVGGFTRQAVDGALSRLAALAAEGGLAGAPVPSPASIETPEEPVAPPPIEDAPPLVHEEPAEPTADRPVETAEPVAPAEIPPPIDPKPIAPTATPAVPDPAEIAAVEVTDQASSSTVSRILLVAAIAIVVGFIAYVGFLQPPR